MGLVLLRDYENWISSWYETETAFYHALEKREGIEAKANAILAGYAHNGLSLRAELLPYRRVGVQGDGRTYLPPLVVSGIALGSKELVKMAEEICKAREMPPEETEKALRLPYAVVSDEIAARLTREVRGVNTVLWEINPDGRTNI